jgi:hypothetical protein
MLCAACCLLCFGLAGCDQSRPEKFAGFASEQLSEQIEIVSSKLDESIEDAGRNQVEILRAVRDLSETVANMQLTSQKQIDELKKVSGKAKAKLTSAGNEKAEVATLDPNAASSAKLQLDSLDDAAAQIEALTKRIDELEKRCKGMATAAPVSSNYPTVASGSGGNSSGSLKAFSGNSNGSYQSQSVVTYSQPVYSEVTYSQPTYSAPIIQPTYQSTTSSQCYTDPVTGQTVCNQNVQSSQNQSYRIGLFGRKIQVR